MRPSTQVSHLRPIDTCSVREKLGLVRVKKQSPCALFDSEVSYAQGMNDLCSRFLEVLDSEVDTFWSFSCYMEKFSKDFRADGLHRKIGEVAEDRYIFVNFSDLWWSVKGTRQCSNVVYNTLEMSLNVLPFRVGGSPIKGTGLSALCTSRHRQHGKLCLLPQVPR